MGNSKVTYTLDELKTDIEYLEEHGISATDAADLISWILECEATKEASDYLERKRT